MPEKQLRFREKSIALTSFASTIEAAYYDQKRSKIKSDNINRMITDDFHLVTISKWDLWNKITGGPRNSRIFLYANSLIRGWQKYTKPQYSRIWYRFPRLYAIYDKKKTTKVTKFFFFFKLHKVGDKLNLIAHKIN